MSTILQFFFKGTLFIAFFWVTDTGQTMGVPTSFIFCHACRSTLWCKQVLCCCKSSFACCQTSCTYMSSAQEDSQVSVLLWLSVVWEAPCPLSTMTLQWSKILLIFKSMTPPKCFVVGGSGKEPWRTDVFFALCDSLFEKSHTRPFKFAQM